MGRQSHPHSRAALRHWRVTAEAHLHRTALNSVFVVAIEGGGGYLRLSPPGHRTTGQVRAECTGCATWVAGRAPRHSLKSPAWEARLPTFEHCRWRHRGGEQDPYLSALLARGPA